MSKEIVKHVNSIYLLIDKWVQDCYLILYEGECVQEFYKKRMRCTQQANPIDSTGGMMGMDVAGTELRNELIYTALYECKVGETYIKCFTVEFRLFESNIGWSKELIEHIEGK